MKNIPLNGLDFIEYASPDPDKLKSLFQQLGFIRTAQHNKKDVTLYQQGDADLLSIGKKTALLKVL